MTYTKTLKIPREDYSFYTRFFDMGTVDLNKYELPHCKNLKTYTVNFDNGFCIDVKINSSDDDVWCEAVLVDEDGYQIDYTEPFYDLDYDVELSSDNNTFKVVFG